MSVSQGRRAELYSLHIFEFATVREKTNRIYFIFLPLENEFAKGLQRLYQSSKHSITQVNHIISELLY